MIFSIDVSFFLFKFLQEEFPYSDGNMGESVQLKRHIHPPPPYCYNIKEKIPDIT